MKTVLRTLLYIFCVLTALIALAFVFLEGRLLFSGDWLVYDNPASGFTRYLLRLTIALVALAASILQFVCGKKQGKLADVLFFTHIALLVAAVVVCFFATNYVGLVCLGLSAPVALIKTVLLLMEKKQKN